MLIARVTGCFNCSYINPEGLLSRQLVLLVFNFLVYTADPTFSAILLGSLAKLYQFFIS